MYNRKQMTDVHVHVHHSRGSSRLRSIHKIFKLKKFTVCDFNLNKEINNNNNIS